ncbi:uncharacterized protein LOC142369511 [Odontesthes bonariensis]|uniref:uncharacterized protein LOC142369511 n=1 Tax=Odontesthes bonariensis TaxID=219752 RepID=UPI003F58EE7B
MACVVDLKPFIDISLCWLFVSGSESQTVKVLSGDEVTLLCSNFSSARTQIIWFKLVNRTQPCCMSFMFDPSSPASSCGSKNDRFEMRSNISTLFLKVKHVDLSDSGLYFYGYYLGSNPVMASATYLEVEGDSCQNNMTACLVEGTPELTKLILGGLSVLLFMVIAGLVVKIKKLQTVRFEQNIRRTESSDSDDVNYAALTFRPATNRIRRPETE